MNPIDGSKPTYVFRCAACELPVTRPVRLEPGSTGRPEDGEPYTPEGACFRVKKEDWNTQEGQYAVNLKDVRNTKYTDIRRRLSGCCGLDGCDGPNVLCVNGHEVGTERSDCWMPHALFLDPACVAMKVEGP